MLKIWDWISGKLLHEIEVHTEILPTIQVPTPTRKRFNEDDEGGKKRGKRGKGKKKAKEEEMEESDMGVGEEQAEEARPSTQHDNLIMTDQSEQDAQVVTTPSSPLASPTKTIVIHKIDSIEQDIVFSAVG